MNSTSAPIRTQIADWQLRTVMSLAVLAQKAETISYDGLAQAADVPSPHRIHKLTSYLEQLIEEDIAANAPIRAALVISKVRGLPAPGFFETLTRCGISFDEANLSASHHDLLVALNPAF